MNPRILIGFGFATLSASLFYMTRHLYPGIDFRTALELRAFQSVGLAFLFVPINTLIYEGIPPEKNNQVSGIVNLARNMGGDIGIAFVTTMAARRTQFHQARLTDHTSRYDHLFAGMLDAVTRSLSTPACRRQPRRTARWRSFTARPSFRQPPWRTSTCCMFSR